MLFLGNSYTFFNDLDALVAALFLAADPSSAEDPWQRLAEGGYTFENHLAQAQAEGSAWEEALVTGGHPWEWVVLQEQSQIPGFPQDDATWRASNRAGADLDGLAAEAGAGTLLLMTWGRREGDDTNPELYPDFLTMQARLAEGYRAYAANWSTEARPVYVAPAGLAFQAVYDGVVAAGEDPLAPDSPFWNLYQADGSHPSLGGSWLVACTIYTALTGESAVGLGAPEALPADVADELCGLAAEVVLTGTPDDAYPWRGGPDDTGDTDTGEPDSGDSGPTDSDTDDSEPNDSGPADSADDIYRPREEAGCACAADPAGLAPAGWGLLLGLAALRRRRS